MEVTTHMIYSHEHGAWWRPRRLGYTSTLAEAGCYSAQDAEQIVADAAYGWHGGMPPEVAIEAARDPLTASVRVYEATQAAMRAKAEAQP